MTAGTTTFRILTIPEVRVCCLRCEELGTRYGAWVPLDEPLADTPRGCATGASGAPPMPGTALG